jgi:GNAT superfamily N-acetyltransferase
MKDFIYKPLTLAQMEEIEALQQKVIDSLEDKSILQPLSRAEFENILGENGVMLGAFDGEQVIASRALLKPDPSEEEHLGVDAGAVDLSRVLYQEVSFVHPAYRGQGLQRKLGERIMELVDLADYDVVCATVKPFNIASLKDKFGQELHVVALKYKYGGKLRYVFAKYLHDAVKLTNEQVVIDMGNIEEQQEVLAQGYVGTKLIQTEDSWAVIYNKIQ